MTARQLDRRIRPDLGADDTGCTVLHVDMDAFFAAVEVRDRPDLAGLPVIVGSARPRGVVLSATYPARRFGVHSAMPMVRARRACPQALIVEPEPAKYAQASRAVMAVLRDVTPLVEPLSLDEAFLDIAGAIRGQGAPMRIAAAIRARVAAQVGVTCSVGVAPVKFVAKIASAQAKPDGVFLVPRAQVVHFLHQLPVSALWGVGERTDQTLRERGITRVDQLAGVDVPMLASWVGAARAASLHELAWGRDPRRVRPGVARKSAGAEHTFGTDVSDPVLLRRELQRLAQRVAAVLRSEHLVARRICLKVRYPDFSSVTRSTTPKEPTRLARDLFSASSALLTELNPRGRPVRLIGLRAEALAADPGAQLALDDASGARPQPSWAAAEEAAAAAADRFGSGAVVPASALGGPGEGGPGNPSR